MTNTVNIPQFVINDMKIRNNLSHNEKLLEKVGRRLKIKATKLLLSAMRFYGLVAIILLVFQNLKG